LNAADDGKMGKMQKLMGRMGGGLPGMLRR